MMNKASWLKVREFAIKAHGDQKYGEEPYVVHLDEVAGVLKEFSQSNELTLTLAYLHDVVEDTSVTLKDIEKNFGTSIAQGVAFLTDESGPNRKERKAKTFTLRHQQIQECWDTGDTAEIDMLKAFIIVKLADRIANLRRSAGTSLIKMYLKERDAFRQAYYLAGIAEGMWDEYKFLTLTSKPVKITVEMSDGTRKYTSGEELWRFVSLTRQVYSWGLERWDVE